MDKCIRILIVEDSQIAQAAAKQHLTSLDCLVDTAEHCDTAMQLCNTIRYDAILMDLGLYPGPNGFDVSKLIKTQSLLNQDTPVIALSIHSEAQFYEQIKDAHISGFISKPFALFEATELVQFIQKGFLE